MFAWLSDRIGLTGAIIVAPIVYAVVVLLILLFVDLPTETFRYLDI